MVQPSLPEPIAPSEVQNPDSPAESAPLPQPETPESTLLTAAAPLSASEAMDDRYYAQHWGINE